MAVTSVKQAESAREPTYGPLRAAGVAACCPVRAVRRANGLSLAWAWGVHVAGIAMLTGVVLGLVAWDMVNGEIDPAGWIAKLGEIGQRLGEAAAWPGPWVGVIFGVFFIELAWCSSAAIAMSWCAQHEKVRASYVRALRRLFLLTPHLGVIVGWVGATFVWIKNSPRWGLRAGMGMDEQGMLIWMCVVATASLWSLWVVFKALGCHEAPAMSRWPAGCEGCGYALVGLRREQDCPECGQAVEATLSHEVRPGVAPPGGLMWWIRQSLGAIFRPKALGKRMRVMTTDPGHRRCLGITVAVQVMLTPIAVAGLMAAFQVVNPSMTGHWQRTLPVIASICIGVSLAMIATTAGAVLMVAAVAGVTQGRRHQRNLMPAAVRAAGYLSGFAVLWSCLFWCSLAALLVVMEKNLLPPISARYNLSQEKIIIYWHYGLVLIGLLIFGVLVERVTKAARHANR